MLDVLRLPFIVHALLTASFAAVVAAVSGYFLVSRGLTFAGHALPNIGFAYDASVPAEALAPDVVDEIKRGDKTILVVGRIDYEDANDGRHATKICISYFPQISGFSACAEGNYLN